MDQIMALCDRVRQIAFDIHMYDGHGHLEKVYENALAHRLRKAGLDVKQQYPLKVFDEEGPFAMKLPGRKTRPAARASPRSFCPLSLRSLRSLRFNRR